PIEEWAAKALASTRIDLAAAAAEAVCGPPRHRDPSQSSLILADIVATAHDDTDLRTRLAGFEWNLAAPDRATVFTIQAVSLTHHTPIRALLTVTGEAWLFGKKVDSEADFTAAQHELRAWVDDLPRRNVALWHATQVLRIALHPGEVGATARRPAGDDTRL